MKLFYVPHTRASRPRWILEELGVPYELVRLDRAKAENLEAQYLAINPTGKVPALVNGEVTIHESAAIVMYLADKYATQGLCPAVGTEARARYYQWILYAMTTLELPVSKVGYHTEMKPEAERIPAVAAEGRAEFVRAARSAEEQLAKTPFILGDSFSAADVLVCGTLAWARSLRLLEGLPHAKEYTKRLIARPAYVKSRAD